MKVSLHKKLKKSFMENFIFCAVSPAAYSYLTSFWKLRTDAGISLGGAKFFRKR